MKTIKTILCLSKFKTQQYSLNITFASFHTRIQDQDICKTRNQALWHFIHTSIRTCMDKTHKTFSPINPNGTIGLRLKKSFHIEVYYIYIDGY